MYKIIYLPAAEYIVDGNSSWRCPLDLEFKLLREAEAFLEKNYFKQALNSEADAKRPIVYCSSSNDIVYDSGRLILLQKHLLEIVEIVEVPDV